LTERVERVRNNHISDFEMVLKVSAKNQNFFDELIEYLKIAFQVKPKSERMYNCETGIYFQYLFVAPKEA
jgi:hypothetical protein